MRKAAVIIPSYLSFKWIAACIWHFKQYPLSIPHELIVCDNSFPHPSIKALTETSLGEGVKIVLGDPDLPSHGQGYWKCWEAASPECDWAFTAENDSFPTRHGWFESWIKDAGEGFELIGPYMPMASGKYVHPAGACISRRAIEKAQTWQEAHKGWRFSPSSALRWGTADWPYHVVVSETVIQERYNLPPFMPDDLRKDIGRLLGKLVKANPRRPKPAQTIRVVGPEQLDLVAGRAAQE